jgi:glyoxylase-like metal-dependent hydrolase (beta-lactamase superfamily II)
MKNWLTHFIALFLCAGTLFAQQHKPDIKITRLTGNFYICTSYKILNGSPFPSNSMYLLTEKGVVLFDTPWDSTDFQPLLDSIDQKHHAKVILCIATHFHDDRSAALFYYASKGIKTYSSSLTRELCKADNAKKAEFVFNTDTTFSIGSYVFKTYFPGEGHTKDNIVIWFEKEKLLYGGCFVKSTENNDIGNIQDANVKIWPASVKKLMQKFPNPKFVIPGHFSWNDKNSLQHTLQLLQAYSNKIIQN